MEFSYSELEHLKNLLVEESQRMDDDGNEGAFAASPLKPIYDKIRDELNRLHYQSKKGK